MGLIEVTTDVSNCDAHQDMKAPIYGAQNATINFGDIDCTKHTETKGGKTDITAPIPVLQLMNLGFLQDFGNGLQTASQYGSQAYKIGKEAAPYAGQAMQYAAPETYQNYAVPATNNFMAAKEFGKSQGGWGAVDAYGQ